MSDSNPVLAAIHAHASVRHYLPTPVEDERIEICVDAAIRAATSSNLQMWSVVVVRNTDARARFATIAGDQQHIREAPVFLVWCADRSLIERVSLARGYRQVTDHVEDFLVAAMDASIAMQNATLAAESLGLGTCYIGGLRNDTAAVIDILGLPPKVFPVCGMTLGYPAKEIQQKPRLPREAFLSRERYTPPDQELIDRYDETMRAQGIYAGRQTRGVRPDGSAAPPLSVGEYSWSEHSARRASRAVRTDLREVLRSQGFELR